MPASGSGVGDGEVGYRMEVGGPPGVLAESGVWGPPRVLAGWVRGPPGYWLAMLGVGDLPRVLAGWVRPCHGDQQV